MSFLKKIRPFDYLIIILLVVALVVGYLTFTKNAQLLQIKLKQRQILN